MKFWIVIKEQLTHVFSKEVDRKIWEFMNHLNPRLIHQKEQAEIGVP